MIVEGMKLAVTAALVAAGLALAACESTGNRPNNAPDGWSILDGPWDAPWFKDRPS